MIDQFRSFYSFLKPQNSMYQYMPFNNVSMTRPRTRLIVITATCIVVILVLLGTLHHPLDKAREYGIFQSTGTSAHDPIPSIVHYVHIKKEPDSVLKFPFASFLNLCAAIMYIKPTKVYIHTDFSESEISNASTQGDRWTQAVITTFADLITWNPVQPPRFAGINENQRIDAIQHKSDFLRWEAIEKIGGVYIDWDVFCLRPLTPLLNAGFAFVGGRQYGGAGEQSGINGTINNGVFMTKPNSAMARIIVREQHAGSNGQWSSNLKSMTKVAERLVPIPGQVLILDRNAFAPTHWFPDSTDALFLPNEGKPSPVPHTSNATDPIELYENAIANRRRRAEWEIDFSATYMLHAFGTGNHLEYITPKIILSRTSNFGIATYDTVRHMMDLGYLNAEDES